MSSPPYTPTTWTNQLLTLYHGTIDSSVTPILTGINVSLGSPNTDFGQGFYTTTVLRQAHTWAWERSLLMGGSTPAVIQFDVDRDALAGLETLYFVLGNYSADDFWSLVFHCRTGKPPHARMIAGGRYDVVVGPVAASWKQQLLIADTDQISFHTPKAAAVLDSSAKRRVI